MDKSSVLILSIAVILIIIWGGYIYGNKRADSFQDFARKRGFSFARNPGTEAVSEFSDFILFRRGDMESTRYFVTGEADGVKIKLFDYEYRDGAGQSATTPSQTVIVMNSGKLEVPAFQLYPNNLFYSTAALLLNKDIIIPTESEFSKTYVVRGEDEDAVRAIFTEQSSAALSRYGGLNIEGSRDRILIYRYGRLVKPEELQTFLAQAMEIFKLFEK